MREGLDVIRASNRVICYERWVVFIRASDKVAQLPERSSAQKHRSLSWRGAPRGVGWARCPSSPRLAVASKGGLQLTRQRHQHLILAPLIEVLLQYQQQQSQSQWPLPVGWNQFVVRQKKRSPRLIRYYYYWQQQQQQ